MNSYSAPASDSSPIQGRNLDQTQQLPSAVYQYLLSQGYLKAAAQLEKDLQDSQSRRGQRDCIIGAGSDLLSSSINNNVAALGGVEYSNNMDIVTDSELEPQRSVPSGALSQGNNTLLKNFGESLILFGLCKGNASIYRENYEELRNWILSSIEMARIELFSLCFPIFAHCYVSLVRYNQLETAQEFWDKWSSEHKTLYNDELISLSMLRDSSQLETIDDIYVRTLLSSKYEIQISQFSYSLLTAHLVSHDLKIVSAIINDHIHFDKYAARPSPVMRAAVLQGFSRATPEVLPSISWGVPGTVALVGRSRLYGTLDDHFKAAMPETRDDPVYSAWLDYIVRPKAVLKEIQSSSATINRSTDAGSNPRTLGKASLGGSSVTFGPNTLGKSSGLAHSSSSAAIATATAATRGKAEEPTVAFTTITNAYEGCICMDMTPNSTQIAAGFDDSCVRVWRLDSKETCTRTFHNSKARATGSTSGSSFNRLYSGGSQLEVLPKAAHGMNLELPENLNSDHATLDKNTLYLRGHRGPVYAIDQDDTGRLVLSGSSDETVRLWDTNIGQCVGKYVLQSPVWSVAFNPIGYYFAAGLMDSSVQVFATDSTSPLRVMLGHVSDVTCVHWHDNASLLVSGSDDKTARLWDFRTGSCVRLFKGCNSSLTTVRCSPLGNALAAGTDAGNIHLWDIGSGQSLAVLHGHQNAVYSLAFSAESDVISSGGADCTIRIWDLNGLKSTVSSAFKGHSVADVVLRPLLNLYTKFTPVYYLNYTDKNMMYAGGPFSPSEASNASCLEDSLANATEKEATRALGLAYPVPMI